MSRQAILAVTGLAVLVVGSQGATATAAGAPSGITRVVIATSGGPVVYTDRAQEDPPAIHIEFRSRNVLSELEPVISVASGMIKEIRSESYRRLIGKRSVKSITLLLTQPAPYTIRQTARQIVIDVETPPSLMAGALDVGSGMTILGIESREATLQRLEAMGAALREASPPAVPRAHERAPVVVTKPVVSTPITRQETAPAAPGSKRGGGGLWFGLLLGAGGTWAMSAFRRRRRTAVMAEAPHPALDSPLPSNAETGIVLDQLVLKAIQRQGQKIISSRVIADVGTMWTIERGEQRHGILCINDGKLFECKLVEQFHGALQEEALRSGTVWALGSFTAPAQTFAKEHGIDLIPHGEVFTLIEAELQGAPGIQETATLRQQLTDSQDELARSKERCETLEQELSTHAEFKQGVEVRLRAWEKEREVLKNRWQESERALAEARADREHLVLQLADTQAALTAKETECTRKERLAEELSATSQQVNWEAGELKSQLEESERCLGEEQTKRQGLVSQIAELEQALAAKEHLEAQVAAGAEQRRAVKVADARDDEEALREEKEREVLKNRWQESERALAEARADREHLVLQLADTQAALTVKKAECSQTERRTHELAAASKQSTQEAAALKEQLEESERCLGQGRTKRQGLVSQIAELEQALAAKEHLEAQVAAGAEQRKAVKVADARDDEEALREEKELPPEASHRNRSRLKKRREAPRVDLGPLGEKGLAVRLESPGTAEPPFIGIVKEMSLGALTIEGETGLASSEAMTVELFAFDSLQPIEAQGRLLRQRRQGDGATMRIELSITQISKRHRQRLSHYLKKVKGMLASPVGGAA